MRDIIRTRGKARGRSGINSKRQLLAAVILATFLVAALPGSARAFTHMVTNTFDSGVGSLRQAISDATDGDTIQFVDGLTGTITLASALPNLNSVTFVNGTDIQLTRTDGTSQASALLIADGKTVTGDLPASMTATATGINRAYSIYSDGDMTVSTLSGSVSAAADLSSAIGLRALGGITLDDLSGTVSATTNGGQAFGLYSTDSMTLGDLFGTVSADSGADGAYGLLSFSDMALTSLSGSVSASTAAVDAEALYASRNLTVGTLSGSVSATAGTNSARGLCGIQTLTVDTLSGSVSATAGGNTAFGLSSSGIMTLTDLSGSVSASAGGDMAYGLYGLTMNLGTLSGSVSASAGGDMAYGVTGNGTMTLTDLSGSVSATAGDDMAYGLYGPTMNLGTLSGSVSATAGDDIAYGLYGLTMNLGTLSGSVSASADGNTAWGLFATDIFMDVLSGSVSATADGAGALGVSALNSLDDGAGGAMRISGTVSARANGLAIAVSSGQGMNLAVTGTLTAEDTSGAGNAYAIASGTSSGGGNWTPGGNYDDTVTLGSGASITGDIDLGGGTNLLNLAGAGTMLGNINNISTLTKSGSGTWSTSGEINTGDLDVDGGTLLVNVSQTAAPTVNASGTVTNNGEIRFRLDPGVDTTTPFTVLSAASLAGAGDYTTGSLLLAALVQGSDVKLTRQNFSSLLAGSGHNVGQLAAALDANKATASGPLADLIDDLEHSASVTELSASANQIASPLLFQGVRISLGTIRTQALATRLRIAEVRADQIRLAQEAAPSADDPDSWPQVASLGDLSGLLNRSPEQAPNGVHLRALGRNGSMDTHDGQTGYDFDTFLLSGGYDRMVGDDLLFGLTAGYAVTGADYDDPGGSTSRLDSYTLGLYGSWFRDGWYVDGLLSGTYNDYDLTRELPALGRTAKSDPEGYALSAKTEAGYRYELGSWGLVPMASLEYIRFHQDAYTESGAGAADLSIGKTNSNFLESGLGGSVDYTWETPYGMLIPELSAEWLHEWLTQSSDLAYSLTGMPATKLSQSVAQPDKDTLRLGAGVRYLMDNGLALGARYQGELEEHARSHSVMLEGWYVF
ncbi:outer membrane autotransporter protein [Pseudodesulfovibrio indicus]|uniref:Outer membrane autotransporter protein n=2 Tax=Pseudodesulfovibrio indicus TaxID=1716143 RepID=A0AA94TM16_9BACT|nr:autotransporter outer membrane beta-barrel domain-containing protein [Pseudodesulfovibrio indicus]TDT92121.1 outer membrane autotransporter protein [Pseudodesulfovibrio indicus]